MTNIMVRLKQIDTHTPLYLHTHTHICRFRDSAGLITFQLAAEDRLDTHSLAMPPIWGYCSQTGSKWTDRMTDRLMALHAD